MYNISALNNIKTYNIDNRSQSLQASAAQNTAATSPVCAAATDAAQTYIYAQPLKPSNHSYQSFKANQIRTTLTGKDEHQKYNDVAAVLDKKSRKDLNNLLKNGKLLSSNSNDNTTTLDNLYNIITKPGILGIDRQKIAADVIERISNPAVITQKFGDVPLNMQSDIINKEKSDGKNISAMDLDVKSSTCPAASIEFNLAHKMPAEFARMAEALTSPAMSVTKKIDVNGLSQGLMNTIWMLNEFGTEHKMQDWNTLVVNLKPDKNAIIRARIQNDYKDKDERSVVDVLMQSTFMNVGAQNTYDTLIDRRVPKYNDDDSGLIDIEKNFAEELATGKGKVCVTYQKIDDNGKLAGYECEQQETLAHIQNTLDGGDNVIIGYTYCDADNNVIGGHEITIIGIETDKKGNKYFVCNDTDDGISDYIKYPVSDLLPKIHHAGIPKSVLVGNVEFIEGWKELMAFYRETKQQQEVQNAIKNNRLTVLNQAA